LNVSPILAATSGSDHGYDVVDPTVVDPERGGPEGLSRFAAAARAAGLGILIDIVPNHQGVADPRQNPWWWDVLRQGQASPHAAAFDVNWALGGRLRLPVLGSELDAAVEAGEITIDAEAGVVRYFDHEFPLAKGTSEGDVRDVLAAQHYELLFWRRGDAELNYRRFFAVTTCWRMPRMARTCWWRRSSSTARTCRRGGRPRARPDTTPWRSSTACSSTRPASRA